MTQQKLLHKYLEEDGTVLTEQEVINDLCLCTNPYIDDVNMLHQSNPPIKLSPVSGSDLNLYLGKDADGIPIVNPNSPYTLISSEGYVTVNNYDNNTYLLGKLPLTPKKYSGNQIPCLGNDCTFEDEWKFSNNNWLVIH